MIRVSFHDSSLTKVAYYGQDLHLSFEDVHVTEENQKCEIHIKNVSKVLADNVEVSTFEMEFEDAEVLDLEIEGDALFALVIWTDFKQGHSKTVSYRVSGERVNLVIPIGDF